MPAIIKPSRIGVSMRTEQVRDGGLLVVSAFLLFDFDNPRAFMSEQALWPMVQDQMSPGTIFDKGNLKPTGDLIVVGAALAPGDTPITAQNVSVRFGGMEKRLAVFGDRYWRLTEQGVIMVEAKPFESMPIDEAHAFGGARYSENPVGKGHNARSILESGFDAPLPNIENPARLIQSIDDTPSPAHFGPIAVDAVSRMRYAGTYDQHWSKYTAPMKPLDFNPVFHCDAPEDQRFNAYFSGDETFSITGMSRGSGMAAGQLPSALMRGFVHRPGDDSFVEIRMICDTVTLFPNVTKAVMTFRGVVKCQQPLCEDAGAVMLACEHKENEARPASYYRDIFRLRTDPETAHKHALSDFQLMPQRDEAEVSARRAARLQKAADDRLLFMENQNWMARKVIADQGMSSDLLPPVDPTAIDDVPLVALPTDEDIERGDLDIAELIDDVETLQEALMNKSDEEMARAELLRQSVVASTPVALLPPHLKKPIVSPEHLARFPDITIDDQFDGAAMRDALAQRPDQATLDGFAAFDKDASAGLSAAIDDALACLDEPAAEDPAAAEAQFEKACARVLKLPDGDFLADARSALADIDLDQSMTAETDGEAPAFWQEATARIDQLQNTKIGDMPKSKLSDSLGIMNGSDIALPSEASSQIDKGGDMMASLLPNMVKDGDGFGDMLDRLQDGLPAGDPDLHDLTLSEAMTKKKADSEAFLAEASVNMADAIAEGRRMSPAALFPMEPFFDGVADRLGIFIMQRLAAGEDLSGADLAGANLTGANFAGRDLRSTFFERCDLRNADFSDADLRGAVFAEADLSEAVFDKAQLEGANFGGANLRAARFDGCSFKDSTFIKTDFSDVSMRGALLKQIVLIECTLDGVDMTGASLLDSQIVQGSANRLRLDGAVIARVPFLSLPMKEARFNGAQLERVTFAEINAPAMDFSHAEFVGCAFLGACDMALSRFGEIRADKTSWNTINLTQSYFTRATCDECLFNGCDLNEVDFRLASLRQSRMDGSSLVGSDLFGANLYAASLSGSDLTRASLRGANLFMATLDGAQLGSADLSGANLGKTVMERPSDV